MAPTKRLRYKHNETLSSEGEKKKKKERKTSSLQLRALSNSMIWMKIFQGNNETRTFLLNQINGSSVLVSKCDNCQIFWARCNQFPVCYYNSFPCCCTVICSYIPPNAILWSQIGGSENLKKLQMLQNIYQILEHLESYEIIIKPTILVYSAFPAVCLWFTSLPQSSLTTE